MNVSCFCQPKTNILSSNIPGSQVLKREIGRSWLASAKIARKAGQWQTAYSAMLQSQQNKTRYSFMESAKLVKAMGDPLHALQQLENSMQLHNLLEDEVNVVDLTNDDNEENLKKMKAKVIIKSKNLRISPYLIITIRCDSHVRDG